MNNNFDLQHLHIQRPEKVDWVWSGGKDALIGIRSKSLRNFLQKTDQVLSTAHIRWEHIPLTLEAYLKWLPYYQAKMTELGYDLFATPEWYTSKTAEGESIEALFFYQNDALVGSGIIGQTTDTAILHFKASDRIDLASNSNSSLGAVIDFLFLKLMIEQGMSKISTGTSRNAFGVINSLGYLDYKLRLGFDPVPTEPLVLQDFVPTNDDGEVVFYGIQDKKAAFFRLKPTAMTKSFDDSRLKSLPIPFIEINY